MKKIRIGNDIVIKWRITINGEEVNLEGLDLSLYISTTYQPRKAIAFTVAGNEITATYKGSEQKITGVYRLTLYRNEGENAQSILDACDAFELVSCSCLTVDAAFGGAEVELPIADLGVGIPGLSAYEIACIEGFKGTQAEWLASLSAASEAAAAECREVIAEFSQAEDSRVTAEAQRVANENNRIAGEGSRVEAENDRAAAEQLRSTAESKRDTAELARIANENNRADAEDARSSAEELRKSNEQSRISEETTRSNNEAARAAAETKRANAETTRKNNEDARQSAEATRNNNELVRQTAEEDRLTNESSRATAESQRVTNETARSNAESNRATSETARQEAETARQEAEQGRATAEQQRADAETARAEEFATFEGKIAAKEDAANKVTSIGADANNTTFPTTRAVLNSIAEVKNIEVTPEMLSESTKQYINASGGGTITNLADDEDLTSVGNVLKLANKDYSPTSYSGMGRVYLRKNMVGGKNILTQETMTKENTIYIIQYDYDLNGQTINVPANCTLDFQGGSLRNGTIGFDNTFVTGKPKILTDIKANSTLENTTLNIDWFGAVKDDSSVDNSLIIKKLGNISNRNNILIPEGTYYSKSFVIPPHKILCGLGKNSILKAMSNGESYSYNNIQIDEIFIAIQYPYSEIRNLVIDGGYNEGYRNVCVGFYRVPANSKIYGCYFNNAVGCIWQRMKGGFITITYNWFNTGIEFCLRLDCAIDSVEIRRNVFEGFNITTDEPVIRVKQEPEFDGLCKSLLLSENRFESVKAKCIYDFIYAGYYINVAHNIYLLGTLEADAIIYRVRKQAAVIRFRDEFFQSVGSLQHYYILDNTEYVNNVIIDNAIPALKNEYIGYFDDSGNYQTWNTVGGSTKVRILLKNREEWLPITSTLAQADNLSQNAVIGRNLQIKYSGANTVLRGRAFTNYVVLQSNRLYVAKNNDESVLNLRPITWLHNSLGGATSGRPTEDIFVGNYYFDTTLGKPIWWNGTAWVDATGQEV